MDATEIAELRSVAEAVPETSLTGTSTAEVFGLSIIGLSHEAMEFIARFGPRKALSLLDEVERLTRIINGYDRTPHEQRAVADEAERDAAVARAETAERNSEHWFENRKTWVTIVDNARIVADHWRKATLDWGDQPMPGRTAAHPLCMVLAALDGETRPTELGIDPDHDDATKLRALNEEATS